MGKTQIYLIRHGQSEGNLNNLFLGHTDMDLTELGHRQAEKTAEYLEHIPADVIYSSDLLRAYHTAQHTAEKKGMEIRPEPGLREVFAGEWEGVPFPRLRCEFKESFDVWLKDFGSCRCDGGESIAELKERVVSALERIVEENRGKSIFIFSHATPIRVLAATFQGLSLSEIGDFPWPSNASVTHLEHENGFFSVVEYSFDSFLGDMVTTLRKENV